MCPELFSFNGFTVHSYGFMLAVGILAGYILMVRVATYRGISKDFVGYLLTGCVLWGVIGARLFYVLIAFENFAASPVNIIKIWEGGLVYWGGFIGGAGWLFYATKKMSLNIRIVADLISPALSLGYAFGRIGCFLTGCCYGAKTDSVISIVFKNRASLAPINEPLIPVQLYASLYSFLLAVFLYQRFKFGKAKPGHVFVLYIFLYSVFRIVIEFFRADYRGPLFSGLTPTQWIAAAGAILSSYYVVILRKK